MKKLLLFCVSIIFVFPTSGRADFQLRIGNGATPISIVAGDNAVVSVFGRFTTSFEASNVNLNAFNLALDFDQPGIGTNTSVFPVSSGISFSNSGVTLGGGYSTFNSINPGGGTPNWDKRLVTVFTSPATMTTSFQRLFDINFGVNSAAPTGIFNISAVLTPLSPTNGTFFNVNNDPGYAFSVINGSISVTAVPEPSSFVGAAILGAAFFANRWRRKRKLVSAV